MARRRNLVFSLPVDMRKLRATESANCGSSTPSRASNFVGAVGVSPGMDGGRNIGVSIGFARSRSDWIGTVGDQRGGRSRGHGDRRGRPRSWDSRRGVDTPGRWSRGPAGSESMLYSRGASPVAVAVRRHVVTDGGAGVPSKA